MALSIDRIGSERLVTHLCWLADRASDPRSDLPLVLDPPFQRGAVWTTEQKQAWIESILLDMPLPAIFINQFGTMSGGHPKWGHSDVVIDGQQRLRATIGFLNDEFAVRGETWSQQTKEFQRKFRMDASCAVILCKFQTELECAELYLKLLTSGTAHTPDEIEKARAFLDEERRRPPPAGTRKIKR